MAPVTASLVFRLFDDEKLRMRAVTLMMVIGMSSMALGPLLAGSVLGHIAWQWLLLINVPVAAIAVLGVWRGVPRDRREDLDDARLDLPGAALTIAAMGLIGYAMTSGVERGWTSPVTLGCLLAGVLAVAGFIIRERTASAPMLDLALMRTRTVRGSAIAQVGSSVAMAGLMFGLMLHFQYAYGWSPLRAGLADLPFIVTMLLATPIVEKLVARHGHRVACLVGSGVLTASLVGLAMWIDQSYVVIAVFMVTLTFGLRILMTVCAVALVEAMPENRTSIGAALNDTAQEVGTTLGTAVTGTTLALLVAKIFPAGAWSSDLVASFFHGERVAYSVLAMIVGVVTLYGSSTLTDSRTTEEP